MPTFLGPFELTYGRPFLLVNFPNSHSPLGDYLPTLALTRQLLWEHTNKVLPKPTEGTLDPTP